MTSTRRRETLANVVDVGRVQHKDAVHPDAHETIVAADM
ncbi:hypothetical protein FRUB_10079 [Fimbriiglobus ruber]|uniref:Uncharacterized protein n=1 Tax=Fimbriiglobus ruber TaxID=1908690 RepID=A0A225D6F9_9BACT|nr:hypothetical protein FRUB_10079 [Fimbriiglobus ruber]